MVINLNIRSRRKGFKGFVGGAWSFVVAMAMLSIVGTASGENPQVDHVLVISVDGLRGDAINAIDPGLIPNLVELTTNAYTFNARTTKTHTNTIPNHTSMLTGRPVMGVFGHLYTDNGDPATNVTLHTNNGNYVSGMFDVAHDNGVATAAFVAKSKFSLFDVSWNELFNPVWGDVNGAVDTTGADDGRDKVDTYLYDTNANTLAAATIAELNASAAGQSLTFLHFRDPDTVGHASSWDLTPGSDYVQSIVTVDAAIGTILAAIDANGQLQGNTAIVVSSDHGGTGTGHGDTGNELHYTIPFLVWLDDNLGPRELYAINGGSRTDPGSSNPDDAPAPNQPIRNGDAANVALDLLGLPAIPGSAINSAQDLAVVAADAVICEDFEAGFTIGQPVGNNGEWFDDGGGPVVTAGAGVAGSVGLAPSPNIFIWTANEFDWSSKTLSSVVVQLDLQTDGSGVLDDDRVGWMISDSSVNSDLIFGVQVDPSGGGDDGDPAGSMRLEGYWDAVINVDENKRPFIDSAPGNLNPNTFYRLRAEFTKLSDTSARIDASLTELDASGDPVAGPPVLEGTITDTSTLGADAPDVAYFTGPQWPAYKNHDGAGANADNACVEFFELNITPVVATFQQGQDGYSSNVDTFLDSGNTGADNSSNTTLVVDLSPERHILMRFDDIFGSNSGQIPTNAEILSATLTVQITNSSPGVGAGLYRMLQPWNDTDSWSTWTGGIQNDGVEAEVAADTSGSSEVGSYELDVTTSLEAWVADPSSNHGWAWLPPGADNSWQMDSAEGATPPELRVVFHVVCGSNAECDDGDACTTDTCDDGACTNEPVVCGEGEVCNEATGSCALTSTIMFQEGMDSYAGTEDTFLQVAAPGNVNGASEIWEWDDDDPSGGVVEPNYGMIRFGNIFGAGPGLIPAGSQIVSATMTYTVFDEGFTASMREVLVDWDESDSLTDVCGGSCDEGSEFGAAEVASVPGPIGTHNVDVTASLQAWSDAPATNFGWFFISQTDVGTGGGVQARSSEYVATPSERPKLTIVYVAGCDTSADCNDGNDCTDDLCNTSGFCEYSNNTDPCDDGDFCTDTDTCSGGACAGTPVDCGSQICNPADGACVDCLSNADCDNDDVCDGAETCDANVCQPGIALDCDDSIACTDDSCDPIDGCANVDNCPGGQVCNLGTGFCEAGPLFVAYNDMNPSTGDSNDTNVTEHDYNTIAGVLVDYNSGTPTPVTITGSFVGGLDDDFPSNGGQANGGTDAGDAFGPSGAVIVDMLNTVELDDPSWDNIITFDNLDSTKRYTVTVSANRNNPAYDNARFTRVTIEGADAFANDSSTGVVVNGADSVSFSIGNNTDNGYVARWTNVTAADGSFSIKSEWDDGQGSGASNTKGYAMTAVKLEEFANTCGVAAECDDGLYCNGVEDCVGGICVAGTHPCGEGAAVCNEDTDTCAVLCDLDLVDEDFNSYSAGQNPTDWYDTAADSATIESDSLFDVKQVGSDLVLGTDSTGINIHSHYVGAGAENFTSMVYTGRMRLTDDNGGIGVTFLSGFADSPTPAYDYHRLRRANFSPAARTFQLEPPSASGLTGDLDSGVDPVVDTWYRFRIVVDAEGAQLHIQANVWEDGQPEPAGFQIDATDTGGLNRTIGTVGVWCMLDGSKYWDDLKVVDDRPDLPCDDEDACTTDDTCVDGVCIGTLEDCDGDGVCDFEDNCPTVPNPGQDPAACNGPFDFDHDGDVDLVDFAVVDDCLGGPGELTPPGGCDPGDFSTADVDTDGDVDLDDFRQFQSAFTDEIVSPCE